MFESTLSNFSEKVVQFFGVSTNIDTISEESGQPLRLVSNLIALPIARLGPIVQQEIIHQVQQIRAVLTVNTIVEQITHFLYERPVQLSFFSKSFFGLIRYREQFPDINKTAEFKEYVALQEPPAPQLVSTFEEGTESVHFPPVTLTFQPKSFFEHQKYREQFPDINKTAEFKEYVALQEPLAPQLVSTFEEGTESVQPRKIGEIMNAPEVPKVPAEEFKFSLDTPVLDAVSAEINFNKMKDALRRAMETLDSAELDDFLNPSPLTEAALTTAQAAHEAAKDAFRAADKAREEVPTTLASITATVQQGDIILEEHTLGKNNFKKIHDLSLDIQGNNTEKDNTVFEAQSTIDVLDRLDAMQASKYWLRPMVNPSPTDLNALQPNEIGLFRKDCKLYCQFPGQQLYHITQVFDEHHRTFTNLNKKLRTLERAQELQKAIANPSRNGYAFYNGIEYSLNFLKYKESQKKLKAYVTGDNAEQLVQLLLARGHLSQVESMTALIRQFAVQDAADDAEIVRVQALEDADMKAREAALVAAHHARLNEIRAAFAMMPIEEEIFESDNEASTENLLSDDFLLNDDEDTRFDAEDAFTAMFGDVGSVPATTNTDEANTKTISSPQGSPLTSEKHRQITKLAETLTTFLDDLDTYYDKAYTRGDSIKRAILAQEKLKKENIAINKMLLKLNSGKAKLITEKAKSISYSPLITRLIIENESGINPEDLKDTSSETLLEDVSAILQEKVRDIDERRNEARSQLRANLRAEGTPLDEFVYADEDESLITAAENSLERSRRDPAKLKDLEEYKQKLLLAVASESSGDAQEILRAVEKKYGELTAHGLLLEIRYVIKPATETLEGYIVANNGNPVFMYNRRNNANVLIGHETEIKDVRMLPLSKDALGQLKSEGITLGDKVQIKAQVQDVGHSTIEEQVLELHKISYFKSAPPKPSVRAGDLTRFNKKALQVSAPLQARDKPVFRAVALPSWMQPRVPAPPVLDSTTVITPPAEISAEHLAFHPADLLNLGYSPELVLALNKPAAELKSAGFTVQELRNAGYTAGEAREAGYLPADVRTVFSPEELHNAGYVSDAHLNLDLTDLLGLVGQGVYTQEDIVQTANLPGRILRQHDFTAQELAQANYGAQELINGGYSLNEIKGAGYTAAEFLEAGRPLAEVKALGFKIGQLRNAGVTAGELRNLGISIKEISKAYGADELREIGVSLHELKKLGYQAHQLLDAGVDLHDLVPLKYNAAQLQAAGCTAEQLRAENIAANELMTGYAAHQLMGPYTEQDLLEGGYTIEEIRNIHIAFQTNQEEILEDQSAPIEKFFARITATIQGQVRKLVTDFQQALSFKESKKVLKKITNLIGRGAIIDTLTSRLGEQSEWEERRPTTEQTLTGRYVIVDDEPLFVYNVLENYTPIDNFYLRPLEKGIVQNVGINLGVPFQLSKLKHAVNENGDPIFKSLTYKDGSKKEVPLLQRIFTQTNSNVRAIALSDELEEILEKHSVDPGQQLTLRVKPHAYSADQDKIISIKIDSEDIGINSKDDKDEENEFLGFDAAATAKAKKELDLDPDTALNLYAQNLVKTTGETDPSLDEEKFEMIFSTYSNSEATPSQKTRIPPKVVLKPTPPTQATQSPEGRRQPKKVVLQRTPSSPTQVAQSPQRSVKKTTPVTPQKKRKLELNSPNKENMAPLNTIKKKLLFSRQDENP